MKEKVPVADEVLSPTFPNGPVNGNGLSSSVTFALAEPLPVIVPAIVVDLP